MERIFKGIFFGLIFGVLLSVIFLVTRDTAGITSTPHLVFRIFVFIMTVPLAIPVFFIPVDGLDIDPYKVTVVLLVLNWILMGGLIAHFTQHRNQVLPFFLILLITLLLSGAYIVFKVLSTIRIY